MSATVNGAVLAITELRDAAAAALAPQTDDDPPVLVDVVDALYPPALMLVWNEPWLAPGVGGRTVMGPCLWTAHLQVLCIGGRVEPGAGIRAIEELVTLTVERMAADPHSWPLEGVSAPRVYQIGQLDPVTYLAAAVGYAVPVTV